VPFTSLFFLVGEKALANASAEMLTTAKKPPIFGGFYA